MRKVLSILFFFIFLALFFSGIRVIDEPVKIVPFDLIFVVFCVVALLILVSTKQVHINVTIKQLFLLSIMLLIWHGIEGFRSSNALRAITLLTILIRDICLMNLVGIIITNHLIKQEKIAYTLFAASVFSSVLSWPQYLLIISRNSAADIGISNPGLIYRTGEGFFPHFQGYSHNPIYFATLALIALMTGMYSLVATRDRFAVLGLLILGGAFVTTFQRGPIVVFLIGLIIMSLAGFYRKLRPMIKKYLRSIFSFIAFGLLISIFIQFPAYKVSPFQRFVFRFQSAEWNLRLERWSYMLSDVYNVLLVGRGLREAEMLIGGQFVESAYIEILYEQGIIGFIFWASLFIYITLLAVTKVRRDPNFLPWFWGWGVVILSMIYVSMHYDPMIWIIAGIIAGWQHNSARGSK